MLAGRFKHIAAQVLLDDGTVLVGGGAHGWERYLPGERRFVAVRLSPDETRYHSTATRLANGDVLIAGGYGDDATGSADAWVLTRGSAP